MRILASIISFLALILIAGCTIIPVGESAQSDLPLLLFNSTQVSAIVIEDDWVGYSPVAPIEAHFRLQKSNDGFDGEAFFSVGGFSTSTLTDTVSIHIPQVEALQFLDSLAQTPVKKSIYRPAISHTDDYPAITITLKLPDDLVVFHTESQGAEHIPWQVTVQGNSYVIYTADVAHALNALDPFLARSIQQDMLDSLWKEFKKK